MAFILAASIIATVLAKPPGNESLVKNLPQMGDDFPYGVYSGMMQLNNTQKKMYYLLEESQDNWETDPLILWSNGGPGCSSLLGWLTELGAWVLPDNSTTFV
jgi:cathepsin A (carboxypeptidase C)